MYVIGPLRRPVSLPRDSTSPRASSSPLAFPGATCFPADTLALTVAALRARRLRPRTLDSCQIHWGDPALIGIGPAGPEGETPSEACARWRLSLAQPDFGDGVELRTGEVRSHSR